MEPFATYIPQLKNGGLLEAAQETFVRAFLGWQKLRKPESKAVVTVEATSSLPDHDYLKKK
jgi:hypothetical protein